jgi:cysteinyl-tRNA synthetase
MNEDAANLGCAEPDEAPKATEYIDQMQNMIGTLVEKGSLILLPMVMFILKSLNLPNMVAYLVVNWMICKQEPVSVLMSKSRKTSV